MPLVSRILLVLLNFCSGTVAALYDDLVLMSSADALGVVGALIAFGALGNVGKTDAGGAWGSFCTFMFWRFRRSLCFGCVGSLV